MTKEQQAIEKTKNPLSKKTLYECFKKMDLNPSDDIVIHSSLSSLGFVIGGAQTVVEVIIDFFKEGTILMPAHTGDLSDPMFWENPPVKKEWVEDIRTFMPAFDPYLTPTRGMGKIADVFKSHPLTVRSNHPQTSFCAHGVSKAFYCENHELTPMFGLNSPLGRLYQKGGKILLLGASFSSCSAFHVSEVLSGCVKKVNQGTSMLQQGVKKWVWFEDYDYDSSDFDDIGNELLKNDLVKCYDVGLSRSYVMDVKIVVDFATKYIRKKRVK